MEGDQGISDASFARSNGCRRSPAVTSGREIPAQDEPRSHTLDRKRPARRFHTAEVGGSSPSAPTNPKPNPVAESTTVSLFRGHFSCPVAQRGSFPYTNPCPPAQVQPRPGESSWIGTAGANTVRSHQQRRIADPHAHLSPGQVKYAFRTAFTISACVPGHQTRSGSIGTPLLAQYERSLTMDADHRRWSVMIPLARLFGPALDTEQHLACHDKRDHVAELGHEPEGCAEGTRTRSTRSDQDSEMRSRTHHTASQGCSRGD